MNRLKLNQPGGVPINADDLQWQITEIEKAFGYIARTFYNQESFKVRGIGLGPSNTITEGLLYHDGRIYHHPQVTVVMVSGNVRVIEIVEQDDSGSNAAFADGISRPLKQNVFARTISVPEAEAGNYIPFDLRTFQSTNWAPLPVKNPGGGDTKGGDNLFFRVTQDGFVHVRGNINPEDNSYRYYLPDTLRPHNDDIDKIFPVVGYTEDFSYIVKITGIQDGGNGNGIFFVSPGIPSDDVPIYIPEFSFRSAWGRLE